MKIFKLLKYLQASLEFCSNSLKTVNSAEYLCIRIINKVGKYIHKETYRHNKIEIKIN